MNKSKNTVKNLWDYVEIITFGCEGYSCVLLCVDVLVVFSVCV